MPSLQAMRAYVMEAWRRRGWKASRVAEMSDDQVLAVYKRLKAEPEWKMYLDQLKSRTCQCEEMKKPGHAFKRSREVVFHLDRNVTPRLISIYGGKLTTYRATAKKVMRIAAGTLPRRSKVADTHTLKLSVV